MKGESVCGRCDDACMPIHRSGLTRNDEDEGRQNCEEQLDRGYGTTTRWELGTTHVGRLRRRVGREMYHCTSFVRSVNTIQLFCGTYLAIGKLL